MAQESIDVRLARTVAQYANDPLGYVLFAFDWANDRSIQLVPLPEKYQKLYPGAYWGPDLWACEELERIRHEVTARNFDGKNSVPAIKIAIASGHGIGKSTLTAWIVHWIMDTRPGSKGMVTANTGNQLKAKTWAEILKWGKKKITAHWWDFKATEITSKFTPEAWRLDAQTWKEGKEEAFAGQHSASSSSYYIFDEASAIPDKVWQVAYGGLTDGEPFFFAFGNPTRNTGAFFNCFQPGSGWLTRRVDSRDVAITNKEQLEKWKEEFGEDSDFFKVRVKGEFPKESSNLFISRDRALEAIRRPEPEQYVNLTAFLGVDVARYGDDGTRLVVRCGRNANRPIERYSKLSVMEVAKKVASRINALRTLEKFERVLTFIDGGGVGGGVVDILRDWGYQDIYEVNFGSAPDDKTRFANKRAELWSRMRDWLSTGCVVNDPEILEDMCAPEYYFNRSQRLVLESKEDMRRRGVRSPDAADALALTFALENMGFAFDEYQDYDASQPSTHDPFAIYEQAVSSEKRNRDSLTRLRMAGYERDNLY